jgi:stage V sporulation protein S
MAETQVLKVGAKSVPNKVASAIVGMTKEGSNVELQSIGAGAVNQANKAVAIANKFTEEEDFFFVAKSEFVDLEIDGQERTGMKLVLFTMSK